MAFEIELSPAAFDHLAALRKFDQAKILSAVEQQLTRQPLVRTRNRKPMRSNLVATWELRVDDFRVYYDVDVDKQLVLVRAIGVKEQNRLSIGGEEVDLS